MRFELDVSLEKPTETIDLTFLKKLFLNHKSYEVLRHKLNNYLLLQSSGEDFKIRIHEDGRIYVKIDSDIKDSSKKVLLKDMFQKLKDFLKETHLSNHHILKNEINFSFYGPTAHSVFWEKYNELNQLGDEALITYDLRTYAEDNDSIYVKLASANQMNI
ncbi:MAG: hypothetical protein Q7U60_01805 [Candidatus Methanoperedens sp.]|nr:hypothetical protein [Candidatus Methanoperedens sp.]